MCSQDFREPSHGFGFYSLDPFFILIYKLQVEKSERENSYSNIPNQEQF